MVRIHRSIVRRANKIDADKVANDAEEYLDAVVLYKADVASVGGLIATKRIKEAVKKIDAFEREILKLEDKIDRLIERRGIEAVKLEEFLTNNLEVLKDYLEPDELRDFRG